MVYPQREENCVNINRPPHNSYSKSRKNRNNKKKNKSKAYTQIIHQEFKNFKRKNSRFALTMSAWAENFTFAATWQLKHQLAFWKARTKALEYENKILHDIIRRNHFDISLSDNDEYKNRSEVEEDQDSEENDDPNDDEDVNFEVSEEYVQFLRENEKFREDARKERELFRAKREDEEESQKEAEGPSQTLEERNAELKKLYGDKWQKVLALETTLQRDFLRENNKEKPIYWPNIPFNL